MDYSVFDNQIDAVLIIDEEKRPVYVNIALATIIGVSPKRIKSNKFAYEYISFESEDLLPMPNGTLGKDAFIPYQEYKFKTFKGNEGTALVSINPIANENESEPIKFWAIFMKDMTVEIQLQEKYKEQLNQKEGVIKELQKAQAELNEYSQNLEKMVAQRTQELSESNKFIQAMVNSLTEGLFVFNKESDILDHYTSVCETIFDVELRKKKFWDILSVEDESEVDSLKNWTNCLFDDMLPFEDAIALGPQEIIKENKHISLKYFPLLEGESLEGVVVVAKDITEEVAMRKELEEIQAQAQMLLKVVKNREQFIRYVHDSEKMMKSCLELISDDRDISVETFHTLSRLLHTIKGSSSIFSINHLVHMAHHYEDELAMLKEFATEEMADEFIPMFQEQLPIISKNLQNLSDAMKDIFSEFDQMFGGTILGNQSKLEVDETLVKSFAEKLKNAGDLELYEEFRREFLYRPIHNFISAYEVMMERLAEQAGKRLDPVKWIGTEEKVDPDRYDELLASLVHYFRNAVDHGIEAPELRTENGKPAEGTVSVEFEYIHKGDESPYDIFSLSISDDGQGISPEIIKARLLENGFDQGSLQSKTDSEIIQYIFEPGFSTAKAVTDVSGRGIGMDAIKNIVINMGGNIYVQSRPGKGTRLNILIPEA